MQKVVELNGLLNTYGERSPFVPRPVKLYLNNLQYGY